MNHELKTWPMYFKEVVRGTKTFEVRRNDRNFKEGDIVALKEFDPDLREYTGREVLKMVGFVLVNEEFVKAGTCVFSLIEPDVYPEGVKNG